MHSPTPTLRGICGMKRVLMLSMALILVVGGCAANKPLKGPERIAEEKRWTEKNPYSEWAWYWLIVCRKWPISGGNPGIQNCGR